MFSDAELKSIVLAVLRGRPDGASEGAIENALQRAIDWGSKVRTQSLLLDLVVAGSVVIAVTPDGEIRFSKAGAAPEHDNPWSTTTSPFLID